MDRPSGGYGGNNGRLHKGGGPDDGLHMVREREKEVSSMNPRFLAHSTVLLVHSMSSGAQRGPDLGRRTRHHFTQQCPAELNNMGIPERSQVKFEVSLRHPNDISQEADGAQRKGESWSCVWVWVVVETVRLVGIAKGESVGSGETT